MLALGDEPFVEGNFLGLGGCETDKDSSRLDSYDNELGQLNKEKVTGVKARVGEASCMGGKRSF